MCDLPQEVLLLIVDQISDFGLWYSVRFVCHAWLAHIVAEQDTKVWKFVKFRDNAFLLPNGVKHGLEIIGVRNRPFPELRMNEEFCYYKYGKLIKKTSCLGHNTFYSIYSKIPFDDASILRKYYVQLSNYYVIFRFIKNECIFKIRIGEY